MLATNINYTHRLQALLVLSFFAAMTLIFHTVGMEFSLYWMYWWFDIIVHFLGGVSIGLLFSFFFEKKYRVIVYLLIALSIGTWEIFEIGVGINADGMEYIADTALDLLLGFFGALVAAETNFRYR